MSTGPLCNPKWSLSLSLSPPRMTPPKGGRPQGRVLVSGQLVKNVHLVFRVERASGSLAKTQESGVQ